MTRIRISRMWQPTRQGTVVVELGHPTEWFLGDLWNGCGSDVRGSEEMIQRNLYQSAASHGGRLLMKRRPYMNLKKLPVIRMPIFIK